MVTVAELAKRRRTVRRFKRDAFSLEKIVRCVEIAKEAPSGINKQPWHFVIVKDSSRKRRIRETCEEIERIMHSRVQGELKEWMMRENITWRKEFLEEAPYLVMVFSNTKAPYSKESTWIAVGYFLLALEEENLTTVTYTPPPSREIAEIVNAPQYYRLEVILPVGYPAGNAPKKWRKRVEDVLSFDNF